MLPAIELGIVQASNVQMGHQRFPNLDPQVSKPEFPSLSRVIHSHLPKLSSRLVRETYLFRAPSFHNPRLLPGLCGVDMLSVVYSSDIQCILMCLRILTVNIKNDVGLQMSIFFSSIEHYQR